MLLTSLLSYSLFPLLVAARGPGRDGDDRGGGDNDDGTPTSSAAGATPSSSGNVTSGGFSGNLTGLTGDSACTSLMCISAVVNGSNVEYVLQSKGAATLGWMAMGFGSTMANTPMVIMWSNSDGSVTLSQRQASGEVMPTVVSSPPRVATAVPSLISVSGSNPKFGYSIPANSDTKQSLIWAFGETNPGSSAAGATLQQHLPGNSGTLSLDLTKSLSSGSASNPAIAGPTSSSGGSGSGSDDGPLLPFQKLIIAHAVLLGIGFLILLPFGALLARYLRTFSPHWFKGHWIIQFYLAGPLIVIGIALGIAGVKKAGAPHLDDDHKRWGIAIFVLYLAQCALGGIIHFVKPKHKVDFATSTPLPRRRPPQNYGHAALGLLTIGLAFYQVRTGYRTEWPNTTGREDVPKGVNIAWMVWVVLLPILYTLGLFLLPRQLNQERVASTGKTIVSLTPLSSHPSSQTRVLNNEPPAYTNSDDGDHERGAASDSSGGPGYNYLQVDENDRDEDERGSYAHGDPDADDVALTAPGTAIAAATSGRRNRSGSRSGSLSAATRSPSSRTGRSGMQKNSDARSPTRTGPMEMRERSAPSVTLPTSVAGSTAGSVSGRISHERDGLSSRF